MNDQDVTRLANHLISKQRLGPSLRSQGIDEIKRYFTQHSSKILLAAMLDAFAGHGHEGIVESEYYELSELGKLVYRFVALIESRGEKLELSVLARASATRGDVIWNRAKGTGESEDRYELRSIIFAEDFQGNFWLRTRHRVIAECLVRRIVTPQDAFSMADKVLAAIAPFCSQESVRRRDIYYRLSRALLDQKWLTSDLGIESHLILDMFSRFEAEWGWNYHFWIQRATFELHSMRRFSVAWDYCMRALEIEDRSNLSRITLVNINFHWCTALDSFPGQAKERFDEAMETARGLHGRGIRDPLLFMVVIRGLFHVSKKHRILKELQKDIEWWTNACREGTSSPRMMSFVTCVHEAMFKAKMQDSAGIELDFSELDSFEATP